mmetsp:Transcript_1231/g.1880  ORF Transcript_1231/g.1880 Transcript_1231/m.1880 type:complete len:387 (-) Transcript_1231:61-1221(-)
MAPPLVKSFISHTVALLAGASSALVAIKWMSDVNKKERSKEMLSGQQANSTSFSDSSISSVLPIIKSPISIFQPNPNLQIAYDSRTKNPIYVMERIRLSARKKTADRATKTFYESKDIPSYHRSRNGYYRKSGYDRGHMAAAANHSSDEEMNDTFSLCNISPQHPVMNRIVWSRLENLTRKLVGQERSAIVITGPLWMPNKILRGENGLRDKFLYSHYGFGVPPSIVQVPTHFFKVVYTFSEDSDDNEVESFAAFVVPNASFHGVKSVNLQNYLVRLTDLEATTGLAFFPTFDEERLEVFDLITEEVWMKGNAAVNDFDNEDSLIEGECIGSSQLILSKNRKGKIRKRLKELSDGSTLLKHMCADGACRDLIKLETSKLKNRDSPS